MKCYAVLLFLFLPFFLLASPLDVEQLRLSEVNMWSRLESEMQSTQSELDGLRNTITTLQYESARDFERQTQELARQTKHINDLSLLLENIESSFSRLLITFYQIEEQNRIMKNIFKSFGIALAALTAFRIKRTVIVAKSGKLTKMRLIDIWL